MRLAGLDIPPVAILAVVVIAVMLLLRSTRQRLRRSQTSTGPSLREQYQSLSEQANVTRDIEAVMLELDQLSRQIHGRLDSKIGRLEALLREADERIDQLSRQRRAAAGHPTLDVTLDPQHPDGADETAPEGGGVELKRDEVLRLADEGLSAVDIARRLGQNTGEVELILSLRQAKSRLAGQAAS